MCAFTCSASSSILPSKAPERTQPPGMRTNKQFAAASRRVRLYCLRVSGLFLRAYITQVCECAARVCPSFHSTQPERSQQPVTCGGGDSGYRAAECLRQPACMTDEFMHMRPRQGLTLILNCSNVVQPPQVTSSRYIRTRATRQYVPYASQ